MLAQKIRAGTPQGGAIDTTMIGGGLGTSSPYAEIYDFSSSSGFGARWANPATLPIDRSKWLSFSPDRLAVAIASDGASNSVTAYSVAGGAWGARISNVNPFRAVRVNFNPSGTVLTVGGTGSPYVAAYSFNSSTGIGSAFSNPGTLPNGSVYDAIISPNEDMIVVLLNDFPYIRIYSWDNSTGFGDVLTAPNVPNRARSCAFNSDGSALFISGLYFLRSYTVSGTTVSAEVSSLSLSGYVWDVRVSPDDAALIISGSETPSGIKAYPLTGATIGAAFSDPASTFSSFGYGCDFTADGSVVVSSGGVSPYVRAWNFSSSSGFGSALSAPAVAATANWQSVRCG